LLAISERSLLYLLLGDFGVIIVLFMLIFWLFALKTTISMFFALLAVVYLSYFLLNTITFKKLIIYENKVVIDRFIFGASIIEIDDTKKVYSGGGLMVSQLIFVSQKRGYFSRFVYNITGLSVIQEHDIITICNKLIQEKDIK
jgi:hypothetical protein